MADKFEYLKEYSKCLADPIYFIETYLTTKDRFNKGYVPFKLFDRQKETIRSYQSNRFTIILKPRQAGISVTTAAYVAWKTAFASKKNPEMVLIISNKLEHAIKFMNDIKSFLSQIPDWMGIGANPKDAEKWTEKQVRLPNDSQIMSMATSVDAIRGFTPTLLIMDEAAHIENGEAVWMATQPSLATGGNAILISTPNGLDELYYKIYKNAEEKKNSFHIVRMNWWEDPRYAKDLKWVKGDSTVIADTYEERKALKEQGYKPTSSWYEGMCDQLNRDTRMIAQELDVSFQGSGGNVISFEYIEQQEKTNVRSPIRTELFDNNMWIWADPVEGHKYILGADVARGDGGDYATISIIDCDNSEQVAEYQGQIPPDILADIIYEYAMKYNAYSVIDITGGLGVGTILKLLEQNFPKRLLHYDNPRSKLLTERKDLSGWRIGEKIPGFNIGANRTLIIYEFERQIRSTEFICRSQRLINEMKTFIYDKQGRPDHQSGYHDDLIFAASTALFVFQTSFKNLEKVTAMTKAMLNAMGLENKPANQPRVISPQYAALQDQSKQYSWLIPQKR